MSARVVRKKTRGMRTTEVPIGSIVVGSMPPDPRGCARLGRRPGRARPPRFVLVYGTDIPPSRPVGGMGGPITSRCTTTWPAPGARSCTGHHPVVLRSATSASTRPCSGSTPAQLGRSLGARCNDVSGHQGRATCSACCSSWSARTSPASAAAWPLRGGPPNTTSPLPRRLVGMTAARTRCVLETAFHGLAPPCDPGRAHRVGRRPGSPPGHARGTAEPTAPYAVRSPTRSQRLARGAVPEVRVAISWPRNPWSSSSRPPPTRTWSVVGHRRAPRVLNRVMHGSVALSVLEHADHPGRDRARRARARPRAPLTQPRRKKGTTMKAAVVTDFTRPWRSRTSRPRPRRPARSWSGSRPAACATPTSTPPTATGRSSRPRRSSPATRASASSRRSAPASPTAPVGDRVALPWLGHACGHCDYCVSGWETLCEQQQNTGYSIDGGFAEFAVADAEYVVPVPDGCRPLRRGAADLRRRHDVQGGQGRRTSGRPSGSRSSASAASATSPCSTPPSSAAP